MMQLRAGLGISVLLAGLAVATSARAESFSTNRHPNPPAQAPAAPLLGGCGDTQFTESLSQAIVNGNSVSCNNGAGHADNSYYRAFDLPTFGITSAFSVCEVQIGIEAAESGGGVGQPITLNLYVNSGAPFPGGALIPIGTANFTIADQNQTIVSLPVTGRVPAGSELVVEIFTPNGEAQGNFFFIGSNPDGQTAPSYLRAPDCGVLTPTTTADLGFAGMDIVMNVRGTSIGGSVPLLSHLGIGLLLVAFSLIGVVYLRGDYRLSR